MFYLIIITRDNIKFIAEEIISLLDTTDDEQMQVDNSKSARKTPQNSQNAPQKAPTLSNQYPIQKVFFSELRAQKANNAQQLLQNGQLQNTTFPPQNVSAEQSVQITSHNLNTQHNKTFTQQNPTFTQQNPTFPHRNPTFPQRNPTFPQHNSSFPQQNPSYTNKRKSYEPKRNTTKSTAQGSGFVRQAIGSQIQVYHSTPVKHPSAADRDRRSLPSTNREPVNRDRRSLPSINREPVNHDRRSLPPMEIKDPIVAMEMRRRSEMERRNRLNRSHDDIRSFVRNQEVSGVGNQDVCGMSAINRDLESTRISTRSPAVSREIQSAFVPLAHSTLVQQVSCSFV